MLSTEAPPQDLLCPRVISQQNSGSCNSFSIDERDSDDNQQQLEVDLFKSDLDDNNNPLPKFSIRDYVSSARGKDIKINWPFSEKNLQLCLEHGVTDVLPPFQSPAIVRNPSRMKCADVKLPALSDKILSCGFQEGNEFESTTRPSYSNLNSVPLIKVSCSKPEAVSSSVEKPQASAPGSRKVKKSTQNSAKNCELIVKLNRTAEPLSIRHSEAMASKVCPVCKTFSFSSNTTLNAHIDQCLSGVSTMDWTSNSKMSKHRIKPRKTRLMVDIYSTALYSTLEDLDIRNGTNWATNMVFPTQDLKVFPKGKKKRNSSIDLEGNEEGAVYVDSSGAKFLSLSKCSDIPFNSNAKDDCGTRKHDVTNKESKFPSRKRRKVLVKRHKSLKHTHCGRTSPSPGPSHCPEVNSVQQKKLFPEDGFEDEYTTQHVKAYDRIKSGEMGMVKKWVVGSKQNGFRKISHDHEQRLDKTVKNLIVKDIHSPRGYLLIKGKSDSNSPVSCDENSHLQSDCHKTKENLQYTSHDERIKEPYLRKRAGLSMMMSRDAHGKRNRLALRKCIVKQTRNDSPLLQSPRTDHLFATENLNFSESNKRNEIGTSPDLNAVCSFSNSRIPHHHAFSYGGKDLAYPRQPPLDHVISPGHKKKSSLRKKFSATYASVPKPEDNSGNRHLNFRNRRLYYPSDSDDEVIVPRTAIRRRDNQVEKMGVNTAQMRKTSVQSSMEPARVRKVRKEGVFMSSGKEVGMALTGSEISPELENSGVRKNIASVMADGVPTSTSNVLDVTEDETEDGFVCEVIPERAGGEAFLSLSKSLDSSFYELTGPSSIKSISQGYVETYEKHCPAELLLGDESEFYADKVANSMTSSNNRMVGEMDANEGQGNYFVDVDQIPIPGPPGSFLPSPGRMSSEELQGNSSLTTCRIQSSEDKHELLDMDSSDSPISSASMVSKSAAGRSDSVSAKNLSVLSDGIQDQSRCNISEDRADESSKISELASRVEQEPNLEESRANLMLTATNPLIFKNSQPCCCSRKGDFLKDSFDCQGSQILQPRSIASLALWRQEKHIDGNLSGMAHGSNVMSQTLLGKVQPPEAENCTSDSQMGGYIPTLVSQNSETKFPDCGDCESPSPSTTNPVLRLMGKNLMVVNKDETLSPQMSQTHLSAAKDSHPSMLSFVDNEVATVRFPNEYYSIRQTLSQVPSRYDCMQPRILAQHLDPSSSNCFENTARIQGSILRPSAFMFSSKSFGGSLASSSEHHEFSRRGNMTFEFGSGIGPDTLITYGVEKVQTHGHQLIRSTDFSGSRNKETLVTNGTPKSEPGLAVKATHGGAKKEVRSPIGISAPVVFGHDSRHMNPAFYSKQTGGYPVCSGSQAFYTANIQVPSSRGILKGNSVQWNCTQEGSAILRPNSLTASSPDTGHPRSSLYFSPGFS